MLLRAKLVFPPAAVPCDLLDGLNRIHASELSLIPKAQRRKKWKTWAHRTPPGAPAGNADS